LPLFLYVQWTFHLHTFKNNLPLDYCYFQSLSHASIMLVLCTRSHHQEKKNLPLKKFYHILLFMHTTNFFEHTHTKKVWVLKNASDGNFSLIFVVLSDRELKILQKALTTVLNLNFWSSSLANENKIRKHFFAMPNERFCCFFCTPQFIL
jgi:hypothetical protein